MSHHPGFFTGKGWVLLHIGRTAHRIGKAHRKVVAELQEEQRARPVRVAQVSKRVYWQFQEHVYWNNDGLDVDQVHALLVTRKQRETAHRARAGHRGHGLVTAHTPGARGGSGRRQAVGLVA